MFSYSSLFGTSTIDSDSITVGILKTDTIYLTSLTPSRLVFSDTDNKLITRNQPNGSLIIGNGGSYSINTITSGSSNNLTITNGSGTITLDVIQNPVFSAVTTAHLISPIGDITTLNSNVANIASSYTGILNCITGNITTTNSTTTNSSTINSSTINAHTVASTTLNLSTLGYMPAQINFTNGTAFTSITCPSSTSIGTQFVLPDSNGSANNLLQTDGTGTTTWTDSPSINSIIINNSSHNVTLLANASGSCNFRFPSSGGSNGYFLSTDGSGNTSWANTTSNSSCMVAAYGSSFHTLTLSGISQNIPGLSASITLPAAGTYRIRADYVVNLKNITLDANVYCYASGILGSGAGSGLYMQYISSIPSSTVFANNVLVGSGFLSDFGFSIYGVSPYLYSGGLTMTVNVKIYTSSSLSTTVTYIDGENDASGCFFTGSHIILSAVPA